VSSLNYSYEALLHASDEELEEALTHARDMSWKNFGKKFDSINEYSFLFLLSKVKGGYLLSSFEQSLLQE